MKAMILHQRGPIESKPLQYSEWTLPRIKEKEVLIKVSACALCRTDLHVIEGDLQGPLPIIPGHQIVGIVEQVGSYVSRVKIGQRVGLAWLYSTCSECHFCQTKRENLCRFSLYTGYQKNGGFAEYVIGLEDYLYPLVTGYRDEEIAPLLCAGIIGYRALKRSQIQPKERLALYGFGSSAHLVLQMALSMGCEVIAISRDEKHRKLAIKMGARAQEATAPLSQKVHSAILFAPSGSLIPYALENLEPGGTLASACIHMSDIPSLNYSKHLFHEKNLVSVEANTREDGNEFLKLAFSHKIKPKITVYPLQEANEALSHLKHDLSEGSLVLST